jgi:hypothetical protein
MAKTRKGRGIIGRVWSPFGHVVNATGNSVKEIGSAAGNLTRRTLTAVRKLGNIWTSQTNAAIKNTMRGGKRRRNTRRRHSTRKHYKN